MHGVKPEAYIYRLAHVEFVVLPVVALRILANFGKLIVMYNLRKRCGYASRNGGNAVVFRAKYVVRCSVVVALVPLVPKKYMRRFGAVV